jgi:hypothetical protein
VNGTADGLEKWGYVDVRPGAHMFWWLYYSYHAEGALNRPIIIWLQVRNTLLLTTTNKIEESLQLTNNAAANFSILIGC